MAKMRHARNTHKSVSFSFLPQKRDLVKNTPDRDTSFWYTEISQGIPQRPHMGRFATESVSYHDSVRMTERRYW